MKALITGGAGLLGSALARLAPDGWTPEVTIHTAPAAAGVKAHRIDLAQSLAFFELAERRRPDLVVHTAYSKTDGQLTVDATTEVASACAALDIPLVHISTDALFDGDQAPYAETDPPSPIHAYGRSKALAEAAVLGACPDAVIVRTSLIVAEDGTDATSAWAIDKLRVGERVTFFDDEFRMPILVDDLATQIWEIAGLPRADRAGVWHLVGPERLSRVEVGWIICDRFGLDRSLVDVASAATMGEPRPRDVSLSSERVPSLTFQARPIGSVAPMAKRIGNELLLHDRVVSNVDLPGVPAGTPGKVILLSGWDHQDGRDWQRFRVLFDVGGPNGTDVGSLSRSTLQRVDKRGNVLEAATA